MVTFCTQLGYVKSQFTDNKSPLKSNSHVTLFIFGGPNDIPGGAEARIVKFFIRISNPSRRTTNHP